MSRPCRIVFYGFLAFYIVALALLAVGTFGWFGSEQDPLSHQKIVQLAGSGDVQFKLGDDVFEVGDAERFATIVADFVKSSPGSA